MLGNKKKSGLILTLSVFISLIKGLSLSIVLIVVFVSVWFYLNISGFLLTPVPVSGASMLPTLPEKGSVEFWRYLNFKDAPDILKPKISRGDIVVFENEKTNQELLKQSKTASGFVKRVIGLPGDTIEIQDGFVRLNGQIIKEEYILKPRSTFGGKEIQDCREISVPKNKLFVLGDNRKLSMDSRQIGLISYDDIDFFIPFEDQIDKFSKTWRDTSDDFSTQNQSLFNASKFVSMLNQERRKKNLQPLNYDIRLEKSARFRASKILENNELENGSSKNNNEIAEAMANAGYYNIVYGEFPMIGYYDEQELFDAFMEQSEAKNFLFNKDYDDIGVSTFIGKNNGCPVQVVVQHLAGYIPPKYSESEKEGWRNAVSNLKKVQTGWAELKNYEDFYANNKNDVDRINEIIALRLSRSEQILSKIESLEWLTSEEKNWITQDAFLSSEQNQLADKLNSEQ